MTGSELIRQLGLSALVIAKNTEDLRDEDCFLQPSGKGSHLNWTLGHIVSSRNVMLEFVGGKKVGGEDLERLYSRGTPPPGAGEAIPLAELLKLYQAAHGPIEAFLKQANDAALNKPIEATVEVLGKTVGDALSALIWHEGYHAGQIGTLRRLAGKPGALQ